MKLYVISPEGEGDFATAVRAAGAIPVFDLDPVELDEHRVAHGATGPETVELVRSMTAAGLSALARGGLDSATVRACSEAGAVGFVVDAAFWLVEDSPLSPEDREAAAALTLREFAAGPVRLPSGLSVGRDALLAPFVARRHGTVAGAVEAFRRSAARRATEGQVAPPAPPAPIQAPAEYETVPLPEAVAIIGVGAVLPKANDAKAFWENVLGKVDAIVEVPPDRWDPSLHHNADLAAPDATYSKIGGFITGFRFDPLKYRIPPSTARALDPVQQMALTAAAEALADAGYDEKPFDRSRCAVILGNSMGGERKGETDKRLHVREFAAALVAGTRSDEERARIERVQAEFLDALPPITEDSMPGELANVIAGRVANVLNLTGKNLTTDAACASSHAALDTAVKAILDGDADMALCGGADRSMDPGTYVKFSKIGALSGTGSRPFDAEADGFVMGEGAAVLLLKRLSDAVRDGDRIYAVIRGIGSSSDGKGKGITAPNPQGQKLAVGRAIANARIEPRHIQLLEAHGTSTRVGDVVEVESAADLFDGVPPRSVAMGSVKSQIGHLKSAAGAAGLLKAALALHHRVLPPSINFETPNPNIDWERVPFFVNTEAKPWPAPPGGEPRRAAASAFGFGGTNFHVILEEYVPGYHAAADPQPRSSRRPAQRPSTGVEVRSQAKVRGELVTLGGTSPTDLAAAARGAVEIASEDGNLEDAARRIRTAGAHALPHRVAFGVTSIADLRTGLSEVADAVGNDARRAALGLKVKGAAYGQGPRADGRVAFLFPGQGSQYVNMCADLAGWSDVVRDTFREADAALEPLIGSTLTDLVFVDPADPDALARADDALKQTEITQPAMLAADVAIFRLLDDHGVRPDMVAGHSLGEYAALVAAEVLSFADALSAVSARGREMANVRIEDHGLMASFSCGPEQAEEILARVDGYAVAANKNCPLQTVVAGATDAVRRAIELAAEAGVDAQLLPVSAAFHTRIVAPASEPLRQVFDRLDVRPPGLPVIGNVDAKPYPEDPDAIRDLLARQVASPVEWAASVRALYDAGCRTFVEVGPKRALASFVDATLSEERDVASIITNHPKRGDVPSFLDALARFAAMGWDLGLDVEPYPGGTERELVRRLEIGHGNGQASSSASFDVLREAVMPSMEAVLRDGSAALFEELERLRETVAAHERLGLVPADVVVSGAAVGLPGRSHRVFDDRNVERLFAGENRIDRLDDSWAARFLDKDLVRLVKDGGEPRLERVSDPDEVLKLAGRRGELDLEGDYGVSGKLVRTLDVTSRLAIAAGYEALYDAGIPMVRDTVLTSTGSSLPGRWLLPPEMRPDTGVVFASAFPGYDSFVREISRHLARRLAGRTLRELEAVYHELLDAVPQDRRRELSTFFADHAGELQRLVGDQEGLDSFNRHFLFSVLSMGHAELAQIIGARGPNTQVNAACSSTTQAIAVAEDWIRAGRCRRVVVVGADDVTSDAMLEWIGAGFLVSGAATTAQSVEEGALPFDRRRHGMIMGMGAVGLVVERREDVEGRGMVPIVRVVATNVSNGAFHGSRLSIPHLAERTAEVVRTAASRLGTTPAELARRTIFVSHETYTPARGGSASAEAAGLRSAFGATAGSVLVTNTKGFTGHAMGAGIEDGLAVKAVQYGQVPPIANLRDIDPEFDGLNLSRGGEHDRPFALRLSAGFGSQLALVFFEKMADGDRRVADPAAYQRFLDRASGSGSGGHGRAERVGRVLKAVEVEPEPRVVPAPAPVPVAVKHKDSPRSAPAVLDRVIELVAEKTGYPPDVLDPDLDLEADLGIDTVKQAELFGELREMLGVARDDGLQLKDYPTLSKVAGYLASRVSEPERGVDAEADAETDEESASRDDVLATVTEIVARRTDYPADILEPDLDMEADLGIDTVKQAEIFGEVREAFDVPRIEGLQLKDFPTIGHVARLISSHGNGHNGSKPARPTVTASEGFDDGAETEARPSRRALTRRVPRLVPAPAPETVERRAFVVGDGPLADELRRRLPARDGEVVVFVGDGPGLFRWAREHAAELDAGSLGVLAITHLGGAHGLAGPAGGAEEGGGVTGLAKALAAEFPLAFVRALDLDPAEDVAVRAEHVERELRVSRLPVEVARTARRGRGVVVTVDVGGAAGPPARLPERSVVVATGGGRGITAAVLKALAPSRPVLVLLGRTAVPDDADAELDSEGVERLTREAIDDLRARGEQPSPVAIERVVGPAKARAEVARTIRQLRAAGADVEYHACDVTDGDALSAVIDEVRRRRGRIDGVIHAAGVQESRRLADKDEGAFERTWRPKVDGLRNLARVTERDQLRFLVVFGSVAGRYGNAAQADYSAANDACAKLMRTLRERGVAASLFAWGPWGETGMATRGSALTVLEAAGVEAIPTGAGTEAFLAELARLDEPEVVLAGSLGALDRDAGSAAVIAERRTSWRADDPRMDEHRVGGVPYLAGVLGLESFAEVAGTDLAGFEDVRFDYPVKLLRDQAVEATTTLADDGRAVLTSVPPAPDPSPRAHFRARLLSAIERGAIRPTAFTGSPWSLDRVYPPFFHGPSFHVIARVTAIAVDGIEARGRTPDGTLTPWAATIEGAFQTLGLWSMAVGGVMALPRSVGRIHLIGPFDPVRTTYRAFDARLDDGSVVARIECISKRGVVAHLEDVRLAVIGPAEVDDIPAVWRSEELVVGNGPIVRVPVEEARRVLVRPAVLGRWLSEDERSSLDRFTIAKRREEWLAATLAAKSALRRAGDQRPWTEIEVLRGDDGAPLPHGERGITLSHAAGVAVARVFDRSKERAGIDVERVEPRPPSFEEEAFTDEERATFPAGQEARAVAVTMAWTAKEATLKALGLGLSADLHSVVTRPTGDGLSVELSGKARERSREEGVGHLDIVTRVEDSSSLSVATGTLSRVDAD